MTTLHKITFTKRELDAIPHRERVFYFMAGQVSNDINILTKHFIFASNESMLMQGQEGKESAVTAQLVLLLKLLAGRLYEAQKMINKTFSTHKFQRKYAGEMSPATTDALQKLNEYFGGKNLIKTIRTRFAFHLEESEIDDIYRAVRDDFEMAEYMSLQYAGHNLFGSAETLCMNAMFGGNTPNWRETIAAFVTEITTISVLMGTFLSGFMGLILKKYVGLSPERIRAAEFIIQDDPPADTVRLPFFCLPPLRMS